MWLISEGDSLSVLVYTLFPLVGAQPPKRHFQWSADIFSAWARFTQPSARFIAPNTVGSIVSLVFYSRCHQRRRSCTMAISLGSLTLSSGIIAFPLSWFVLVFSLSGFPQMILMRGHHCVKCPIRLRRVPQPQKQEDLGRANKGWACNVADSHLSSKAPVQISNPKIWSPRGEYQRINGLRKEIDGIHAVGLLMSLWDVNIYRA